jgi:hypothetical protein
MKKTILILAITATLFCSAQNQKNTKIQVLNFGTFHMGETSDANKNRV